LRRNARGTRPSLCCGALELEGLRDVSFNLRILVFVGRGATLLEKRLPLALGNFIFGGVQRKSDKFGVLARHCIRILD